MVDTDKVSEVIEVIRPAIQADAGDIFLRGVDAETGVVSVELVGACVSCPGVDRQLKAGIERILKDRASSASPRWSTWASPPRAPSASDPHRSSVPGVPGPAASPIRSRARARATAGRWPACSRWSSGAARLPARWGRAGARPGRRRLHGRHHGCARFGQVDAHQRLIDLLRRRGERVAVLAIDPSSPFWRGDPRRPGAHGRPRGRRGCVHPVDGHPRAPRRAAVAAPEAVRVLTAAGYPWVLLETVGVGQVEVEVVGQADTVVVVNPGWGDAVQANKAGLMEIADVFVVNKADRQGAEATARDLRRMLDMAHRPGWRPPVVCTTATSGAGVDDLWQAVADHRAHLASSGGLDERRRRRAAEEVTRPVAARLLERAQATMTGARAIELAEAAAGELGPGPWPTPSSPTTPRKPDPAPSSRNRSSWQPIPRGERRRTSAEVRTSGLIYCRAMPADSPPGSTSNAVTTASPWCASTTPRSTPCRPRCCARSRPSPAS